nr:hypothetical protein [Crucivirus sp.]
MMVNFSEVSEVGLFGGLGHKDAWKPRSNKEAFEHYGPQRHREQQYQARQDEAERTRMRKEKPVEHVDANQELIFGENNELVDEAEYKRQVALQEQFGGGSTPLRVFNPTAKQTNLIKKVNKKLEKYSESKGKEKEASPLFVNRDGKLYFVRKKDINEASMDDISFNTPTRVPVVESPEPNVAGSDRVASRLREGTHRDYSPTRFKLDASEYWGSEAGIKFINFFKY